MIPYILHAGLLLAVCLIFYKLLLQKETFYRLNRFILLAGIIIAVALPLWRIPQGWSLRSSAPEYVAVNINDIAVEIPAGQPVGPIEQVQDKAAPGQDAVKATVQPAPATPQTSLLQRFAKWMVYLYWLGVAVFGLNLLLQVVVLFYQAYTKPVMRDGRFRIVELSNDKAPCSFGNNIFINPSKYEWDTYNQILLHEKVHIRQKHSIDILLAELVLVFQWFNPFAWLYRKELEKNLEYLTDEMVLQDNTIEKSSYQLSLLKVCAPHLPLSITTNYNQSLLKKRILMMNAKKSNIHIMWKYFTLVPVLGLLVCAFNQPMASAQTAKAGSSDNNKETVAKERFNRDRSEGSWFATIKNDKVHIEFKNDDDDHNWTSSTSFLLSELSSPLPKGQKGEFSIKREAGTILFSGKFEDELGYGHYKFTPDKAYNDYIHQEGIDGVKEEDLFTFFMIDIRKNYIAMLKNNGFTRLTKNELIPLAALKVDEPYIKMWKENGYSNLTSNELVSAKSLKIDGAYVNDIRKAGYKNLSINELISFKAQGITGDYINGLRKAKPGKPSGENELPPANEIAAFKSLKIDSGYISEMAAAGYKDLPYHELTAMKSLHITPEYAKGFADIGYNDIPAQMLIAFKSQNITPEYIKSFEDAGLKHLPLSSLSSIKALNITPEYIKSFESLGYKNIPVNNIISIKSMGITPEYIKGFKDLGFSDISLNELPAIKSSGVTPEYVAKMKQKGFNSNDLRKYAQLKRDFDNGE